MSRLTVWLLLAGFLSLGHLNWSLSQDTNEKVETKQISPLRKLMDESLMDESLSWTELMANQQAATPMTVRVVMRWANNTRGSEDGMTVLNLAAGRPEAVCCVYPWEKLLCHEFDSLSRGTLIAKRDGEVVWRPEKAGAQFHAVPEADAPAETAAARLRQMKTLANQFSSTMLGWRANNSDREPLRMLPQPLYRYDSKRRDLLDGAVFAFVQGTDPESLLLLEAFKKGDGFEWQFAFARRTSRWTHRYDPKSDQWTKLPDMPSRREYTRAVAATDAVYVMGGTVQGKPAVSSTNVFRRDLSQDPLQWKTLAPLTVPRSHMAVGKVGPDLVVAGGNRYDLAEKGYSLTTIQGVTGERKRWQARLS